MFDVWVDKDVYGETIWAVGLSNHEDKHLMIQYYKNLHDAEFTRQMLEWAYEMGKLEVQNSNG